MKLGGGRGEAAAAAEILKSTGRSGSQPRNFGTCASKLSGETRNSVSFEQVIIRTQTGGNLSSPAGRSRSKVETLNLPILILMLWRKKKIL